MLKSSWPGLAMSQIWSESVTMTETSKNGIFSQARTCRFFRKMRRRKFLSKVSFPMDFWSLIKNLWSKVGYCARAMRNLPLKGYLHYASRPLLTPHNSRTGADFSRATIFLKSSWSGLGMSQIWLESVTMTEMSKKWDFLAGADLSIFPEKRAVENF